VRARRAIYTLIGVGGRSVAALQRSVAAWFAASDWSDRPFSWRLDVEAYGRTLTREQQERLRTLLTAVLPFGRLENYAVQLGAADRIYRLICDFGATEEAVALAARVSDRARLQTGQRSTMEPDASAAEAEAVPAEVATAQALLDALGRVRLFFVCDMDDPRASGSRAALMAKYDTTARRYEARGCCATRPVA
jgi:hypothetical protein